MSTFALPPSPLLSWPGAVAAEAPDAGIAWHYGDPMAEQRTAVASAGLVDDSRRGLIAVTGADRLTWLNTLTSQQLGDLPPGTATEALILSPQGHVEHHLGVTVGAERVLLETEAAAADDVLTYLTNMIFWSDVRVAPALDLAALRLIGPRAADIAASAGHAGARLTVERAELGRIAADLVSAGARPIGSWAVTALRIAARMPRWGLDVDARTIPNELPWLDSAVHLHKGCYRGQETVARVHNLGRPPRRLVRLHLDGSVDRLPEPGDDLLSSTGRVVGRVGSAAHHYEDGPIGLALVKRSVTAAAAPGRPVEPLLAGGVDAAIDPDDLDDPAAATSAPPLSAVDRRAFPTLRRG